MRHGFWRCPRAAATALVAAVMTLMCVGGIALTSDHTHLVYQRDILQAASDAASLAATRQLGHLPRTLSDREASDQLAPLARRYVLANMPASRRERAAETLALHLDLDRTAGTVQVTARADLGGAIIGSWLYGNPVDATRVLSGSESEVSRAEVVLAFDVTTSMALNLAGRPPGGQDSRMDIVKRAATNLVRILNPGGQGPVAIGLVPWHHTVRLGARHLRTWEQQGWVQYPSERFYPRPYRGYRGPGELQMLPATPPQPWRGCLDRRTVFGPQPPGLLPTLPSQAPFTMGFFPVLNSASYACNPAEDHWGCYSDSTHPKYHAPQFNCNAPPIVPLTTDAATIITALNALRPAQPSTYSPIGMVWGQRLLTHSWRPIWGHAEHPVDPARHPGVKKVLVLLTDGEDNHPGCAGENRDRTVCRTRDDPTQVARTCQAAKDAGILVFTITALNTAHHRYRGLVEDMTNCASRPDYAFVNNATPEALEQAFRAIAHTVSRFRRTT